MSVKDGLVNRTEKPRKYTDRELIEETVRRLSSLSSDLLWVRIDMRDIMESLGISRIKAAKKNANTNTSGFVWDQDTPDRKIDKKDDRVWTA